MTTLYVRRKSKMNVLLGKYHIETCSQYISILEENGIEVDYIEPTQDYALVEGYAHRMGEIFVSEEQIEIARLIVIESEKFSEKIIQQRIKPEIKNEFKKGLMFIAGSILLGTIVLLISKGDYGFLIAIGVIVSIIYLIRKNHQNANNSE